MSIPNGRRILTANFKPILKRRKGFVARATSDVKIKFQLEDLKNNCL